MQLWRDIALRRGSLGRVLLDQRPLWRVWAPLLLLSATIPLTAVSLPLVEKRLIDGVVLARRIDRLPEVALLYVLLWGASTVMLVASSGLRAYFRERVILSMRARLLDQSARLSVAFSHTGHSGQTVSLFDNDVPLVADLFSSSVLAGVGTVITLAVAGAAMFVLSRQLALAALIVPPALLIGSTVATRPLRRMTRAAQAKAAQLNEALQEHLAGMREVITFSREQAQAFQFASTMRELLRLRMRIAWVDAGVQGGQSLLSLAVTLTILGYGSYLVVYGHTTLGSVVAMNSLFAFIFQPAGQLFGLVSGMQRALGAADRIYEYLDQQPRVTEIDQAEEPAEVGGEIRFDHVDFAYAAGAPVLSDICFEAHPGEVVALVGPSGAGKSTLMSLLLRFYDPTAGSISLDGVDTRRLALGWLRDQIGVVFQDSFLFATTVRENIAFGWAGSSEAEIVAAAKLAQAWEFIERLPQGLDTLVGERGVRLSEGQKQRLAIARALLRDPAILILDEPTAALDARSEKLLQAALDTATAGRTTFVIAHRLATVQRAHRILVLDQGRIVESGTHAELLRAHGLYRELFELQFGRAAAAEAALATTESGREATPLTPLSDWRPV